MSGLNNKEKEVEDTSHWILLLFAMFIEHRYQEELYQIEVGIDPVEHEQENKSVVLTTGLNLLNCINQLLEQRNGLEVKMSQAQEALAILEKNESDIVLAFACSALGMVLISICIALINPPLVVALVCIGGMALLRNLS
jgi:hypothetical protein